MKTKKVVSRNRKDGKRLKEIAKSLTPNTSLEEVFSYCANAEEFERIVEEYRKLHSGKI